MLIIILLVPFQLILRSWRTPTLRSNFFIFCQARMRTCPIHRIHFPCLGFKSSWLYLRVFLSCFSYFSSDVHDLANFGIIRSKAKHGWVCGPKIEHNSPLDDVDLEKHHLPNSALVRVPIVIFKLPTYSDTKCEDLWRTLCLVSILHAREDNIFFIGNVLPLLAILIPFLGSLILLQHDTRGVCTL